VTQSLTLREGLCRCEIVIYAERSAHTGDVQEESPEEYILPERREVAGGKSLCRGASCVTFSKRECYETLLE
jgi:hypothetical protein